MRLLLDTYALLWHLGGSERLSANARAAIEDDSNERLYRVAGAWEIAIKVSLGKLMLRAPPLHLIPMQLHANAIALLPIEPPHIAALTNLPFYHRNPFDRMMVAQAEFEDAVPVSVGAGLDACGVHRIW